MQESGNPSQYGSNVAASPTVLIVDDETFARRTFRAALEAAGCRVVEACCGEEAVDLFPRLTPELLIVDLVMPGMDGFETCAALRCLDKGKYTPILAVTGLQDSASVQRAFEAGATDFISKPVSDELLGHRVRYLLRSGKVIEELARSEANLNLLRAAVESLPIGITVSDAEGKIIYTNPAEAAMHGFEVGELMQQQARVFGPQRLHRSGPPEKIEKYGIWRRESVNRRKGGEEFPAQLSSVAVRSPQGKFLGIVTACEDITERKKSEAQIHRLAYYDNLTGLPNRTLFLDRLQKALALAERSEQTVAVLFLDLDNFKDINDTQGHEFGDRLLQQVARRLSSCIRTADTLVRLGGDEFVVMLSAVNAQKTAGATAMRILETFKTPFDVDGRRIYAGISIGIAVYPDDASDLEGVLRSADTAMYQAKARGRQTFQFFSAEMNRNVVERVAMESALRQAMEREDLRLFYQPQWDLQAGHYSGVEVLLRWFHPEQGEVSPARFIPLAENSGQIFRLGGWALRSACAQASAWARAGCPVQRVAVNVSAHQLREPGFLELVVAILAETGFDPRGLELEFTESVLMEHSGKTVDALRSLKKMGVQLSIDDFGTGYSSLSYLKHFPVDRIKIDCSFVAGIDRNADDTAIVTAVIALARNLKIRVLAEGVETRSQLEFLQRHGCSEVQGFFLGVPMAADQVPRHLAQVPEPLAFW